MYEYWMMDGYTLDQYDFLEERLIDKEGIEGRFYLYRGVFSDEEDPYLILIGPFANDPGEIDLSEEWDIDLTQEKNMEGKTKEEIFDAMLENF